MTIAELKEVLEDRLLLTGGAIQNMINHGEDYERPAAFAELEGRYEEMRVVLDLLRREVVKGREENPLVLVPTITFRPDEAEPGKERHDPARC